MKIPISKAVFGTLITKSVAAGQTDNIIPLGSSNLTRQFTKQFIKFIEADKTLMWDGANTTVSNGYTVSGFAFWANIQATQSDGFAHRHRILALVRPDGCRVYAVPVPLVEHKFALPDIELADSELEAYLRIADSITPAPTEYTVHCPRPAKDAVKSNRGEWRDEELNPEALGQLLQQHADWLFPVITAALDV